MFKPASALICLTLLAAAPAMAQRMYKCVDAKGKVYYTQVPPPECLGRETDVLNKSGAVTKRTEAALTPEQIQAREAERKRKFEEEEKSREERRKNQALLSTYSSEKDIDDARARALKENDAAISATEKRIEAAMKQGQKLESEKEFYAKKSLPPKLVEQIKSNEIELKTQQDTLQVRKKQASTINAKYDEDKRRYLELTRGKAGAQAASTPAPPKK